MAPMPKPKRRRAHLTLTKAEHDQLTREATAKGLRLMTYLHSLVVTHPARA